MKKKGLIALGLAVVLATMPVVAGAAYSPSGAGSSSGSSGGGSGGSRRINSTSSGIVITAGLGMSVPNSIGPSVEVTADGGIYTVYDRGSDQLGANISIVIDGDHTKVNEDGRAYTEHAYLHIAYGEEETAGLPSDAVQTISMLNAGADVSMVGLQGYHSVGGTRAVVSKNADGVDAATIIHMKVDMLVGASGAGVSYYNNNSGLWEVTDVLSFDPITGIVVFWIPGSVTVKFGRL